MAQMRAMQGTEHVEASSQPSLVLEIADVVDRAAIDARRRFRMPIGIGYLRVGDEESLTFHVAARDTGPAMAIGEVAEFRFLHQVAASSDPLVIPNVESHPVFAQLLLKGSRSVRGFCVGRSCRSARTT